MQEIKSRLRQQLLLKRKSVSRKADKDAEIFRKLLALPQFAEAESLLTYVSQDSEVDTRALISYCFENNIPVAVPGIVDEEMRFFRLKSMWKIEEEINCQLCIVPGLAFDPSGRRLGYGGGYYDKFLAKYNGIKIGLCYKEFLIDIPVEEHDERVDLVIWN